MNTMTSDSLPPAVAYVYRQARVRWRLALLTPLLYLLIAIALRTADLIGGADEYHPWDRPAWWGTLGVSVIGLTFGQQAMRRRQLAALAELRHDSGEALRGWSRGFLIQAVCADGLAFLGLLDFIISGRLLALPVCVGVSYLAYAAACPRWTDLRGLREPAPSESFDE
jgi:hypothetical protein